MSKRPLLLDYGGDASTVPTDIWFLIVHALMPHSVACVALLETCHAASRWLLPVLRRRPASRWRWTNPVNLFIIGLSSGPRDSRDFAAMVQRAQARSATLSDADLVTLLRLQCVHDSRMRRLALSGTTRYATGQFKWQVRRAMPSDAITNVFIRPLDGSGIWECVFNDSSPVSWHGLAPTVAQTVRDDTPPRDLRPLFYIGKPEHRDLTLTWFERELEPALSVRARLVKLHARLL